MSDTYKPSEHDGLKQDGTPDKRMEQTEFAYGKVDPHEAGKQGGHSTGGTGSSESESTSQSGNSGGSAKGQFAHGKVDPHEAGKKGGRSS